MGRDAALMAATRSLVCGWSSRILKPGSIAPAIRSRIAANARASPPTSRHQSHSIEVGRRLDLARIGRLHDRLRRDHHHAAAGEVAEQHAEQKRQAGGLQQRAGAVAVRDVTDLVRDDAGELVGAARPRRPAPRTRKCVRPAMQWRWRRLRRTTAAISGIGSAAPRSPAGRSACRGRRGPAFSPSAPPHSNGLPDVPVSSMRAHLGVHGVAEPVLDRQRDQRREPVGQQRHPEHGDQDERHGGGEGPGDHPVAQAPLGRAAAVERVGTAGRFRRSARGRAPRRRARPGRRARPSRSTSSGADCARNSA